MLGYGIEKKTNTVSNMPCGQLNAEVWSVGDFRKHCNIMQLRSVKTPNPQCSSIQQNVASQAAR